MSTNTGGAILQQGALAFGDEWDMTTDEVKAKIASVLSSRQLPRSSVPRPKKVDASQFNLELPLFDVYLDVADASDDIQSGGDSDLEDDLRFSPVPQRGEVAAQDDGPRLTESTDPLCGSFHDQLQTFCGAHAGVLYRSLELLLWAQSPNSRVRKEVVEWIFTDVVEYTDTKDGKTFRVPARDFPFSFEVCCIAEDIDVDELRDAIWDLLEGSRKGLKIKLAALH